ncbi:TetR family transcriptional regulator [Mastigocoleus testarum BC008]|uniref:TetR family transcriptional regulator n=2 Tax=Mastigocoleus TaxID=996924 RepID=A0A0V7ZMU5_9CYAN|nr:TetR family transcriptional regulator [Mastigocoleus testarum BC008]
MRRQPKQKRSKERVNRILDTAAEVFLEMGFDAATTHDIATRADTAVGSLYQFFPDKLAIFHALELRHIEQGRILGEQMYSSEMAQLPLEEFIAQMVEKCVKFFDNPAPKVMFIQYFTNSTIFKSIDESFTQEFVKGLANMLSLRNPNLSSHKCHLLADVCTQSGNALLLVALRSDETYRQQIISQIKNLITAYLRPHVGDEALHNKVMIAQLNNEKVEISTPQESQVMKCPHCKSERISKNGHRHNKQRYICKECGKQFSGNYSPKGYPEEVKQRCLGLYRGGMGFRAIEKKTGVSHNTVINWVKQIKRDLIN